MCLKCLIGFFVLFAYDIACAKIFEVHSDQRIDWDSISDGDVVCLSGKRVGTIEITKNITLDGQCDTQSNSPASLTGLVTPQWKKLDNAWRTVEKYPLKYGRYTSWVLLNDILTELEGAKIYRKGDYFYSSVMPGNIQIPKYYAAIIAKGTTELIVKNLNISYYHTNGARFINTTNTVVENLRVSWFGGGINPSGFPRAGDGITFDGNTKNALIKNSHAFQCFDTGFAIQLFKSHKEIARKLRFINISTDKCGAGISVATHKSSGTIIDDVEIVGKFLNSGYGWSSTDNSVHGRGVLILQHEQTKVTNIKLYDSLIDRYTWVGVLQISGELDAWNNIIKNGTGEYLENEHVKPAAYTAHGLDYSREPSDDEAIGSFYNNTILNNNGYAFQVIHNRPKLSTRQLTIKNNRLLGNKAKLNMQTSSDFLK